MAMFRSQDGRSFIWGDGLVESPGWLPVASISLGTYVTPDHLCPDLLTLAQLGPADNLRGRLVRTFFSLMRYWPPRGMP